MDLKNSYKIIEDKPRVVFYLEMLPNRTKNKELRAKKSKTGPPFLFNDVILIGLSILLILLNLKKEF
jgi:hypothetical protein